MSKKNWIIPILVLAVAVVLLLAIKGEWLFSEGSQSEQQTDDAYVRADVTPLSTRVSGTVRKLNVNDYEAVHKGEVLVELDDDDYHANVDGAKAALAAAHASYEDNQSAKRVADAQIQAAEDGVQQANSAIEAANAGITAVQSEANRAGLERRRQEALIAASATTQRQVETAVADDENYAATVKTRQADLSRAQAALATSQSQVETAKRQRAALDTRDNVLKADIQAKEAAIVVSNVNFGYTKIAAPTDGSVGERHVQEGQLVGAGAPLIDLVKGDVWIQANYKETQLTNMRVGDAADIHIDAFPGTVLHGKVAEISPASGSQFALLPPDNATGNYTKVVQRIPVKIVLDSDPLADRLRPGFSAVVTVHVSQHGNGGNS